MGSVGAIPAVLALSVAVLGAAGALADQPVGAVGAAGDRPDAGTGPGGVAFGVQLHHHPGAEGCVVLGAAHPLGQLPTRPRPDWELTMVERHKPRVKARGRRPPAALAGRLGRALPDGLGVAGRHAQPVPLEGFA
jgi:hypothetical protein